MKDLIHAFSEGYYLKLAPLLLICGIFVFSGCSSSSNVRRGSLKEAVRKSSDSHKGERRVARTKVKTRDHGYRERDRARIIINVKDDDTYYEPQPQRVYKSQERKDDPTFVGFNMYSSLQDRNQLPQLAGAGFNFGTYSGQHNRHSLGIGVGQFPLSPENELYGSLVNTTQVNFTYQYRRYLGSHFPTRNFYTKFEVAPNLIFWEYNNPVYSEIVDDYGRSYGMEEIISDGLWGCGFGGGFGFSLIKSKAIELGLDGTFGLNFTSHETTQGFQNDLFYPELFMKWSVEVDFK